MVNQTHASSNMLRRTFSALLAPIVGAILFFATFEVVLRITFHESMDFTIEMWKYATNLKTVARNSSIGHEHRPSSSAFLMGTKISINSKRLRDREFEYAKPLGKYRVLMLGDSLTFGWGVEQDKTTPKVLENILNSGPVGDRFEVINAGVGNYNTAMEVAYFLDEGLNYKPDLVVLNYFINDAEDTPRQSGGFLAAYSYAYVFLQGRIDTALRMIGNQEDWAEYYRKLYSDAAAGWKNTKANLRRLAEFCRRDGIPLLFVNYPELRRLNPYPFPEVNATLAEYISSLGVDYLDLLPTIREQNPEMFWVTREDPHPNATASGFFAEAIGAYLRKTYSL